MINDLSQYRTYKKAKVIVEEIRELQKILALTKKSLSSYYRYVPVKIIFAEIIDNQAILNAHLKKYKEIVQDYELARKSNG